MPEEAAALHQQIAQLSVTLTDRTDVLDDRLERIEKALLGDRELGLSGMVDRVDRHERLATDASAHHDELDERRVDGDRRLHARIDNELEGVRTELAAVGRKVDRLIWMAFGAGAAGTILGGGSVWAILGGLSGG